MLQSPDQGRTLQPQVRRRALVLNLALLLALFVVPIQPTAARIAAPQLPEARSASAPTAVCVVTNTSDAASPPVGSLRAALANATCSPIVFDPSLTGQTITLTAELSVARVVVIDGAAAPGLKIDGNNSVRLFNVTATTANLAIYNLTLQRGKAPNTGIANGGAVLNQGGTVVISNTAVLSNTAGTSGNGGALRNQRTSGVAGILRVYNSVIMGNTAPANGGAFSTSGSITTIVNSAVLSNTVTSTSGGITSGSGLGAGIHHVNIQNPPANLTTAITNTTIAYNRGKAGAAIYNDNNGIIDVYYSTIAYNAASNSTGSIVGGVVNGFTTSGQPGLRVSLYNTIVANNTQRAANTALTSADVGVGTGQTITSNGYNLIETVPSGAVFSGSTASNITGQDPALGEVQNNGGGTPTAAVLQNSPAYNAGDPAPIGLPATDQRGPGFVRVREGRLDIGAFEASNSVQTSPILVSTNLDTNDGACTTFNCSLREAITLANSTPQTDTIRFNLLGSGVRTISPTAALPTISAPVILDGLSQAGAACNAPLIELNGSLAGANVNGLEVTGGNSLIRGLVINRFTGNGVRLATLGRNTLECNFIGTDPSGTVDAGNGLSGVRVESANTLIGGSSGSNARNLISGNDGDGITLVAGANATTIQNNYIGTSLNSNAALGNSKSGVRIGSDNNQVGGTFGTLGNIISGNVEHGVLVNVSSAPLGNRIQGNFIGTNIGATLDIGNSQRGVFIDRSANTLVGGTTAERNVISGNNSDGVAIIEAGATNNKISGNYIGTNNGGGSALGNSSAGVYIFNVGGNTIGGTTTAERNLISANSNGIVIGGGSAIGNIIKGNYIGTTLNGNAALGNVSDGIKLDGARNTQIGGLTIGERNVISGNGNNGINIFTASSAANVIQGNYIGTNAFVAPASPTGVANQFNGVRVAAGTTTTIGGSAQGAGNVIAFNAKNGVLITQGAAVATTQRIQRNSIFSNNRLGIDLGPDNNANGDGVTANDANDSDTGPNNLLNYPVVESTSSGGGLTQIVGSYIGAPNAALTLDFYGQGACDPSNFGEGQTYIGSYAINTGATGAISYTANLTTTVALGQRVTATAVDANGNTSEFSRCSSVGNLPSVSVNDVTVVEGNSGTTNLNFTLSLSAVSASPVVVSYVTADDTAIAPADYTAASSTATIPANSLSVPVTIEVHGDTQFELNERFFINLLSATNAAIGDGQGIGSITNDDSAPTISVNAASANEGSGTPGQITVPVTLSNASYLPISVEFVTTDGTASAPSDYTTITGTLNFAPGETSKTIDIATVGDLIDEPDETINVALSNAVNTTISNDEAIATILDDDATPVITVANGEVSEGNSGSVTVTLNVSLSNPSSSLITVDYATVAGSATANVDFTSSNGSLSFAPGETSKTIDVQVLGDLLDETDESFSVELSNPSNATAGSAGTVVILDDDAAPMLDLTGFPVLEGNTGTKPLTVTATLSAVSGQAVTVQYATFDNTATAGSDYTAISGTLTIPAGQLSQNIFVNVNGDLIDESNETFTITVSNPQNANLLNSNAIGTIIDDDGAPTINANTISVTEGDANSVNATFTVSLSNPSATAVSVNYSTLAGTALSGTDFTPAAGTLNFAPGELTKTVTVVVLGDLLDEADETFTLVLSSATGGATLGTVGTATIVDNDPTPSVALSGLNSVIEGSGITTTLQFTVTLSTASGRASSVQVATTAGTASAGSDFVGQNLTLNFAAGETQKVVSISIVGDRVKEPNETFSVGLSNPSNLTLGTASIEVTIIDDDEWLVYLPYVVK
ncbi:beta strand repeat-containing protein [Herpetosiphon giganteus]|uniref:beta strand repeat-containing protein n=1 Tax=Herpetosiphon giganteus TaxID=2029754 RepID=UPI0019592679|nr:Calx-beta domain-containing protein [Herpetosiphon giganteus]MBM7841752.1 CSLREA domain-containing protein [Herpetosiphon giganteus]